MHLEPLCGPQAASMHGADTEEEHSINGAMRRKHVSAHNQVSAGQRQGAFIERFHER